MRSIGLYVFVSAYCVAILVAVLVVGHTQQVLWCVAYLFVALGVTRTSHASPGKTVCLTVCAMTIAFMRVDSLTRQLPAVFIPLVDTKVELTGTIVALPDMRETSQRITLETRREDDVTRIIASVPLYPALHVGDHVIVRGTLKLPKEFETDGGRTFDYPSFLAKDGIFGVIQPAGATRTGSSETFWFSFLRSLEWIRKSLTHLLGQALSEPQSSLAVGLIVGGKQGLGKELLEAFTIAGMLQIVVLSGYNVMIVANTLMHTLAMLPSRVRYVVASFSMLSFVLLAGAGSSALRAGLMAYLGLTARAFGKQYNLMRAIAVSVFLLALWNPLLIPYDPGFQFSFIATLGLALGTPLIAPKLLFLKSPLAIELFASTLAAEMGLLPLLLWQTGNLSLVSVFANVLAMPLVAPAMAASAVAAALALPLSVISEMLPTIAGLPAYLPLYSIIAIATHSAALPFAHVIIPTFSFWYVSFAYALLIALVVRGNATPPHQENDAPRRSSSHSP